MKPKKSILFIAGSMVGGGAEKVLLDILRNIDYNTYDVDLALVEKSGILLGQVPEQVNIIELWKKNSFHYFMAVKLSLHLHFNILFSQRLNGNLLRKDYDTEIACLEGLPSKLLALRKTEAKRISWIHTDLSKFHRSLSFFGSRERERKAYNKIGNIITISHECRKGFIQLFPELAEQTKVSYNPVDIPNIIRKGQENIPDNCKLFPADKLNIISVGRLSIEKNPFRMLEVAAIAKKRLLPFNFIWVGEGDLSEEFTSRIKELDLEDVVTLTGFKSNPYPYINKADILLLPSDAEGFPLVVCEAMVLGIPVISTPTTGPLELFENNQYGIIADFSPESIVEAINTLYKNPDQRKNLAEKGKEKIEEYSVTKAMERFYNLINPLL